MLRQGVLLQGEATAQAIDPSSPADATGMPACLLEMAAIDG